ncbi:transposase [Prevotella nigrescens]|nr:transposase [Prevotella nigrescens]
MDFPVQLQRCIYTTNWIEKLNKKYKWTIRMGPFIIQVRYFSS